MHRKDFFKKGIWKALKGTIETTEETYKIVSETISTQIVQEEIENTESYNPELPQITKNKNRLRNLSTPPGSSKNLKEYQKLCTGCGDCIQACPYNAIFPVFEPSLNKNIAYLDTNNNPCMLCFDYPCINSCSYKALKPLKKKLPKFGKAFLKRDSCINFQTKENSCNSCRSSCPVEKAISFSKNHLPKFEETCTGCGICVQSCPSLPKSIFVKQ